MRIGVISDIHGNLEALEAVLALLDGCGCDEIIHTGDVVDIGPRSRECLRLLLSRKDVTPILGNHDRDYLTGKTSHTAMSHVSARHKKFVFDSIGEKYRKEVARFPLSAYRTAGGVKMAFVHYALQNDNAEGYLFKKIESYPTAEKLDVLFGEIDADAVFFGHKHEPCDIRGKRTYVDVGSVGCHEYAEARAVVITATEDGRWGYERVSAPYDRRSVLKDMINSGLPDAQYIFDFYFDHKFGVDGGK